MRMLKRRKCPLCHRGRAERVNGEWRHEVFGAWVDCSWLQPYSENALADEALMREREPHYAAPKPTDFESGLDDIPCAICTRDPRASWNPIAQRFMCWNCREQWSGNELSAPR